MSGKFSGFSQADIDKVKMSSVVTNKNKENVTNRAAPIRKLTPKSTSSTTTATSSIKSTHQKDPLADQATKKQQPQQQKITEFVDESQITSSVENSLQEAIQFQPLPIKICAPITPEHSVINKNENNGNGVATAPVDEQPTSITINRSDNKQNRFDENGKPILFKGVSLKEYETQRRMIEEQNKQKKELLSKAIEQRYERTAAEAKKLNDIKYELDELESELASDVALLRKHIDMASVKYMNAHKYYQQIETAFLKAKMDVQQAREKKDLLAEHLNIIITTNEDKKAQKLSHLMEQVGLTKPDDEFIIVGTDKVESTAEP